MDRAASTNHLTGEWRGTIDLGWHDGRRKRKYVAGKTKAEAVAKLRDLRRQLEQAPSGTDGRMTVGSWLNHYLTTLSTVECTTTKLATTTSR
jgi:hypothetical protein